MVRGLAVFYGCSFLLGGLLGFVPGITPDGMFFGIFVVNTPHGIMHLLSGATFLVVAAVGAGAARLWFQTFGIIYAALAAMGFAVGDGMILHLISNNLADAWGHAALAASMLTIGYARARRVAAVQS